MLGFERLYPGNASVESTLYDWASAAGGPQVTLYGGDEAKGRSGVLTLGGPDATNCAAAWTHIGQIRTGDDEWELQISG